MILSFDDEPDRRLRETVLDAEGRLISREEYELREELREADWSDVMPGGLRRFSREIVIGVVIALCVLIACV